MDEPKRKDDSETSRRAPGEGEASGLDPRVRELIPARTVSTVEIEIGGDATPSVTGKNVQARKPRVQPKIEIPTTELQRRFVKEYLLNGKQMTAAYKKVRSTKKPRTAIELNKLAKQLLNSAGVQYMLNMADERRSTEVGPVLAKYAITEARIAEELAKIALSSLKEVMAWGPDGVVLKDSEAISDDAARTISEVSATSGKNGTSVKVKQYDKVQALVTLGKALGMFKEERQEAPKMAVQFVINRGD